MSTQQDKHTWQQQQPCVDCLEYTSHGICESCYEAWLPVAQHEVATS